MNCLSGENERLINNDIFLSTAPSPAAARSHQQRTGASILGTIFLIVNTTLGAGLLNFPQAFDRAGGIATAIITQLIFLVFITAALIILANCSDITNATTMQDMFAGLCGQKSLLLCGISVAVYSFGCCLTFIIIVGDQFDRVLATYYGLDYCHTWYLSRSFVTIVTCSLFILPFCFFKRLDVLSYASSLGCLTILYVVSLVIYKSFTHDSSKIVPMKIWPDNEFEALQIVPIICFAYQSHMTAIPTYACMKKRTLTSFTICATISMLICFVIYSIIGIFGYSTFGTGKVPSDILQGYAEKNAFVTVAIVSVAVKNFTTYPIVLYCGRDALLGIFGQNVASSAKPRVLVTLAWFIVSLAIAVLVPDISPVINLLGTLSAFFIFILPGVSLLQSILQKDPELYLNKDRLLVFFAILLTTLGAFVSGVVFIEALEDLRVKPEKLPLVTGFRQLKENLCV